MAYDWGLDTDQEIWERLASMNSFRRKGGLPKKSRWFAWHEQAQEQLPEFWGARTVMEWYCSDLDEPDETLGGRFTGRETGGLKVYYNCLKHSVWERAWMMFLLQQPLWQWYCDQVKNIKTPIEGVRQTIALSTGGAWMKDKQIQDVASMLARGNSDVWSGLVDVTNMGKNEFSTMIWKHGTSLIAHRCNSMSKHDSPPESWSGALSDNDRVAAESLQTMGSDFASLLAVERSRAESSSFLAADLRTTLDPVCRLAATYESSEGAQKVLKLMLEVFPDSKIVEDVHQRLRKATDSKGNDRLHGSSVQQVVQDAGVLEQRGIHHGPAISQSFGDLLLESFCNLKLKVWKLKLIKLSQQNCLSE